MNEINSNEKTRERKRDYQLVESEDQVDVAAKQFKYGNPIWHSNPIDFPSSTLHDEQFIQPNVDFSSHQKLSLDPRLSELLFEPATTTASELFNYFIHANGSGNFQLILDLVKLCFSLLDTPINPDPNYYMVLIYMAKKFPSVYSHELIWRFLITILKPDTEHQFKRSIQTPVLAACLLYQGFKELQEWPVEFVQLYLEDAFDQRLWIDDKSCYAFTDNILTFLPKKNSLSTMPSLIEDDKQSANIIKPREPNNLQGKDELRANHRIQSRFHSETTRNRVQNYVNDILQYYLAKQQHPQPPQRVLSQQQDTINIIRVMQVMSPYPNVRLIASIHLDRWLSNHTTKGYARDLFGCIIENTTESSPNDIDIVNHLVRLLNIYTPQFIVDGLAKLVTLNPSYPRIALYQFLQSDHLISLSEIATTNYTTSGLKVISKFLERIWQTLENEKREEKVASIIQELVISTNPANYILLKQKIRLMVNLLVPIGLDISKLCIEIIKPANNLLKEATDDNTIRKKWINQITEIVANFIFMIVPSILIEISNLTDIMSSISMEREEAIRLVQNQLAMVHISIMNWCRWIGSWIPRHDQAYFEKICRMLLFLDGPHSYGFALKPMTNESLIRCFKIIELSPMVLDLIVDLIPSVEKVDYLPMSQTQLINIIEQVVIRAAKRQINSRCPLLIISGSLTAKSLFELARYSSSLHPSLFEKISQQPLICPYPIMVKHNFWKVCGILLVSATYHLDGLARFMWEEIPTMKYLMQMVITHSWRWPPLDQIDHSIDNQIALDEANFLSKLELIIQDNLLSSQISNLGSISDNKGLDVSQLMIFDQSGPPRCPPSSFIQTLKKLDHDHNLSFLFSSSRDPDFVLDIMNQDIKHSIRWLGPIIKENLATAQVLPLSCIVRLLFHMQSQNPLDVENYPLLQLENIVYFLRNALNQAMEERETSFKGQPWNQILDFFFIQLSSMDIQYRIMAKRALLLVLSNDDINTLRINISQSSSLNHVIQPSQSPNYLNFDSISNHFHPFSWLHYIDQQFPNHQLIKTHIVDHLLTAIHSETDPLTIHIYLKWIYHQFTKKEQIIDQYCSLILSCQISSMIIQSSNSSLFFSYDDNIEIWIKCLLIVLSNDDPILPLSQEIGQLQDGTKKYWINQIIKIDQLSCISLQLSHMNHPIRLPSILLDGLWIILSSPYLQVERFSNELNILIDKIFAFEIIMKADQDQIFKMNVPIIFMDEDQNQSLEKPISIFFNDDVKFMIANSRISSISLIGIELLDALQLWKLIATASTFLPISSIISAFINLEKCSSSILEESLTEFIYSNDIEDLYNLIQRFKFIWNDQDIERRMIKVNRVLLEWQGKSVDFDIQYPMINEIKMEDRCLKEIKEIGELEKTSSHLEPSWKPMIQEHLQILCSNDQINASRILANIIHHIHMDIALFNGEGGDQSYCVVLVQILSEAMEKLQFCHPDYLSNLLLILVTKIMHRPHPDHLRRRENDNQLHESEIDPIFRIQAQLFILYKSLYQQIWIQKNQDRVKAVDQLISREMLLQTIEISLKFDFHISNDELSSLCGQHDQDLNSQHLHQPLSSPIEDQILIISKKMPQIHLEKLIYQSKSDDFSTLLPLLLDQSANFTTKPLLYTIFFHNTTWYTREKALSYLFSNTPTLKSRQSPINPTCALDFLQAYLFHSDHINAFYHQNQYDSPSPLLKLDIQLLCQIIDLIILELAAWKQRDEAIEHDPQFLFVLNKRTTFFISCCHSSSSNSLKEVIQYIIQIPESVSIAKSKCFDDMDLAVELSNFSTWPRSCPIFANNHQETSIPSMPIPIHQQPCIYSSFQNTISASIGWACDLITEKFYLSNPQQVFQSLRHFGRDLRLSHNPSKLDKPIHKLIKRIYNTDEKSSRIPYFLLRKLAIHHPVLMIKFLPTFQWLIRDQQSVLIDRTLNIQQHRDKPTCFVLLENILGIILVLVPIVLDHLDATLHIQKILEELCIFFSSCSILELPFFSVNFQRFSVLLYQYLVHLVKKKREDQVEWIKKYSALISYLDQQQGHLFSQSFHYYLFDSKSIPSSTDIKCNITQVKYPLRLGQDRDRPLIIVGDDQSMWPPTRAHFNHEISLLGQSMPFSLDTTIPSSSGPGQENIITNFRATSELDDILKRMNHFEIQLSLIHSPSISSPLLDSMIERILPYLNLTSLAFTMNQIGRNIHIPAHIVHAMTQIRKSAYRIISLALEKTREDDERVWHFYIQEGLQSRYNDVRNDALSEAMSFFTSASSSSKKAHLFMMLFKLGSNGLNELKVILDSLLDIQYTL